MRKSPLRARAATRFARTLVLGVTQCFLAMAEPHSQDPGALVVTEHPYHAKGDGVTDDTEAFQRAIHDAGAQEAGGTVFVPRGTYLIAGTLRFPPNVTLEGVWQFVPTPYKFWHPERAHEKVPGTVLLATAGEGQETGTPFISLHVNCVVRGITIYYPNQLKANPPKAYPWTIAVTEGGADHCTIENVLMVNPYQAVDFGSSPSGRHFIRNLYAYPLRRGIFVDKCYDIGRIENVHLWPFWGYSGDDDELGQFVSANAEAFIFGRTDWEYVSNSFSIFYNVGFRFIRTNDGSPNVLLTQSGADICPDAVLVEDCQSHAGVSFSNSQIFGRVTVKESNTGMVRFTNCGFFGATREDVKEPIHLDQKGRGHVSFDNCHFITLDPKNTARINLLASAGSLSVVNCLFKDLGRVHVQLEEGLRSAVLMGNTFDGQAAIVNHSRANVQVGLNADVPLPEEEPGAVVIDDMSKAGDFGLEGDWHSGWGGGDYLGALHWAAKGNGQSVAAWRPNLAAAGTYAVYVWYGGDPMGDHATDAPFCVHHAQGDTTVSVNLREQHGRWRLLGDFPFAAGTSGYVTVSNAADGNVVADAVKFVPK